MIKILADITLPNLHTEFKAPFKIATYQTEDELQAKLPYHDILLCRSTLKVTPSLLKYSKIQCVASASSGVDHIDEIYLNQHNIQLFDAKGANAIAVADYVVSTLASLHKRHLLKGNKAGVIGIGEVGSRVVQRLNAADFDVVCYDPLNKNRNSSHHYGTLDDLMACDVISVHANWHKSPPFPSDKLINHDFLLKLKKDTVIINASRGNIVDETALLQANQSIIYCTDVYANEPDIDARIIDFATLCTPHIAGHSIEGKLRAITTLSQKLYAHYHLIKPSIESNLLLLPSPASSSWQDYFLNLYDPSIDTEQLKSAINKSKAFLTQRQAHVFRHDYPSYDSSFLSEKIQHLIGHY